MRTGCWLADSAEDQEVISHSSSSRAGSLPDSPCRIPQPPQAIEGLHHALPASAPKSLRKRAAPEHEQVLRNCEGRVPQGHNRKTWEANRRLAHELQAGFGAFRGPYTSEARAQCGGRPAPAEMSLPQTFQKSFRRYIQYITSHQTKT